MVPELTRPWKPEIAPQAIVTNSSGMIGGVPGGTFGLIAGATITGAVMKTAAYRMPRPMKS